MEVKRPMSMVLHILADRQNVVEWQLALKYMRTSPSYFFLESNGLVAYMETHPKSPTSVLVSPWNQYTRRNHIQIDQPWSAVMATSMFTATLTKTRIFTAAVTTLWVYVTLTWFEWVTVVMSANHHRFGSLWVAFFVVRVLVLGIGLHAVWHSWIPQCTSKGGCHIWVVWHQCWVSSVPPSHMYFGYFFSFPFMGLYSPRVVATQVETDFPM